MTSKISINRNDLEKIQEVLTNFPDVHQFELVRDDSSGIGYTLDVVMKTFFNNMRVTLSISVVDESEW